MPNFPWPGRRDVSAISDASLEALLAGAESPTGSPPELRPVAEALAALAAAPTGDELTGEAEAMAVFRERLGVPSPTRRRRRRPTLLSPLLSSRAAAAAAVAALGIGGFATAAFTGSLPDPVQQFAHHTFAAPAAHASQPTSAHPRATATPAGPDATGPAAFGLCTAWAHAKEHGTAKQKAVAFRNLAQAAGGASNVASYCGTVPHPGASHSHPAGKPSSHPTSQGNGNGNGKPSTHPTPAHPTGKPGSHPTSQDNGNGNS
jgi:hypothetical protein